MKRALLLSLALAIYAHPEEKSQQIKPQNQDRPLLKLTDTKTRVFEEVTVQSIIDALSAVQRSLISFTIDPQIQMVYLLGYTGAGKSTLVNYLIGGDMGYQTEFGNYIVYNKQDPNWQVFPEIGNDFASETMIPRAFTFPDHKISFVDTAGFMSTEGPIQEIADSYANARVFQAGNKVKIAMVVEYSSLLASRGEFLIQAAKKISQMFPKDFIGVLSSSSIIITKVDLQKTPQQHIEVILRKILASRQKLDPHVGFILQNILNRNQVYILPIPSSQKINQHVKNIQQGLFHQTSFLLKNDAQHHLSAQSKIQVENLAQSVEKYLSQTEAQIKKKIKGKYLDKVFNNSQDIKASLHEISELVATLNSEESLNVGLITNFLNIIGITDPTTQEMFLKNIEYLSYCKYLHEFIESQKVFERLKGDLEAVVQQMRLKLEKSYSKEQIQKIMSDHRQQTRKMEQKFEKVHQDQIAGLQKQIQSLNNQIANMNRGGGGGGCQLI